MIILGIETSCDDTGVAVIKSNPKNCQILSNIVSSQIKTHAPFGGVVPNLAARDHLRNIKPCLKRALKEAEIKPKNVDLIAVTVGPGLIPSLLVGANFAKALSYAWQKPIMGINHIEGHIYANWIEPVGKIFNFQFSISKNIFPALCLVVSGGHTQLILVKNHEKYKLIGETRDDAAGEAFDKVAKLLGLGYPGGPIVSKMAKEGNPLAFNFPRPMINAPNYDFSFSGLKTAVFYLVKKGSPQRNRRSALLSTQDKEKLSSNSHPSPLSLSLVRDICASFEQAAVEVLIKKTIKAAGEYKVKNIMIAGGVAANQELRKQFQEKIKKEKLNFGFYAPSPKFCADNAAMIAIAARYKYQEKSKQKYTWQKINANANLKLTKN